MASIIESSQLPLFPEPLMIFGRMTLFIIVPKAWASAGAHPALL
jgi:hypothetical protein